MSNLGFLFAGFALAWAVVFAYIWYLAGKSARLARRVDLLEERLRRD